MYMDIWEYCVPRSKKQVCHINIICFFFVCHFMHFFFCKEIEEVAASLEMVLRDTALLFWGPCQLYQLATKARYIFTFGTQTKLNRLCISKHLSHQQIARTKATFILHKNDIKRHFFRSSLFES